MNMMMQKPLVRAPESDAELLQRLQALSQTDLNLVACCANSIDIIDTAKRCNIEGGVLKTRERMFTVLEELGLPVNSKDHFPKPSSELKSRLLTALRSFKDEGLPLTNEQRAQLATTKKRAEQEAALRASMMAKPELPAAKPQVTSPAAPAPQASNLSPLATHLRMMRRGSGYNLLLEIAAGATDTQLCDRHGWAMSTAKTMRSTSYAGCGKDLLPRGGDRPALLKAAFLELQAAGHTEGLPRL